MRLYDSHILFILQYQTQNFLNKKCKLILKPILTDLGSSNLFFREKGEEGPVLTYLKPGFGSSECSF